MTLGNITYGQWRTSWSRRGKVYDAPAPNHPTYGSDCLMCNEPMKVRPIQLIAIGLTDDENEEDTRNAKLGEVFAAGWAIVHQSCAKQMTDEDLDVFAASLIPTELLSA
jgi:hypothetical protein